MVNLANTELVARCIPLAVQPATISQNSATNSATMNATNSLKALANAVLERNRQCNHTAIDTLKATQLLPENNSDKAASLAPQLQGVLSESDKQKISAWVCNLGGSEETIAEELADCLEQCLNEPEALAYFLKRSEEIKPAETSIVLIQCGNCQNFTPHYAHGKGTGICKAGVMPFGVCHWSETQHTCNGFNPKPTEQTA